MDAAKRTYSQMFKQAEHDPRVRKARDCAVPRHSFTPDSAAKTAHALGRSFAKEAASPLLRNLALLGGGLGLAGGGFAAGRYLMPRDPSEEEALSRLGITEPGEYNVGVPKGTFEDGGEAGEAAEEPVTPEAGHNPRRLHRRMPFRPGRDLATLAAIAASPLAPIPAAYVSNRLGVMRGIDAERGGYTR